MTHIACGRPGEAHPVREVALATGISEPTVAKTLQTLARRRLLVSRKGPGGGFSLARPAEEITLGDIVVAIDGAEALFSDCVAGLAACSEGNACPLHERWEIVRDSLLRFFAETSLADMAKAALLKGVHG